MNSNNLTSEDLKFIAKKTKLDLAKTKILTEEESDLNQVLLQILQSKSKPGSIPIKKLSPAFVFRLKLLSQSLNFKPDKDELNFFVGQMVYILERMLAGDKTLLRKISLDDPNPERSCVVFFSMTLFRNQLDKKEKDNIDQHKGDIKNAIISGFNISDIKAARLVAKNYENWEKCLLDLNFIIERN